MKISIKNILPQSTYTSTHIHTCTHIDSHTHIHTHTHTHTHTHISTCNHTWAHTCTCERWRNRKQENKERERWKWRERDRSRDGEKRDGERESKIENRVKSMRYGEREQGPPTAQQHTVHSIVSVPLTRWLHMEAHLAAQYFKYVAGYFPLASPRLEACCSAALAWVKPAPTGRIRRRCSTAAVPSHGLVHFGLSGFPSTFYF